MCGWVATSCFDRSHNDQWRLVIDMYKTIGLLGLACGALVLVGCSAGPSKAYTINGEFIAVEAEVPETTDGDTADEDDALSAEPESDKTIDLSTATVVVSYESTNDEGEMETVELASGSFVDGKVAFEGEIEAATEVKIAVATSEGELSATALVVPGGDSVDFALVEYEETYPPDQLVLVGASRASQDEGSKFTITGDFSGEGRELSTAVVEVFAIEYVDGARSTHELGTVMLDQGVFVIENDIEEPTVVSVYLRADSFNSAQAVVEPESTLTLSWHGTTDLIIATSDSSRHQEVVESWNLSDEYMTVATEYSESYAAYIAEIDAAREAAAAEGDSEEPSGEEVVQEGTESDAEEPIEENNAAEEIAATNIEETVDAIEDSAADALAMLPQPAEGCEHVSMEGVEPPQSVSQMMASRGDSGPDFLKLRDRMNEMMADSLREIAKSDDNPLNSLLAMELGAYNSYSEDRADAFPIYDKLAMQLDADLVARRITPRRDSLQRYIETEENDSSLIQGQKAPEFTLANLQGEEIALYDVLSEREIVLVDFWASWCGPCIATFPDLKRMYAAYNDDGFEIVAISIDSTFEDWQGGSEKHELPWIDLGEIKGWEGPIASAYGVQFIPKAYLVDSEGCILEKNIHTDKLEELLVAKYGEMPVVDEDSSEAESVTDDPGADDMGG